MEKENYAGIITAESYKIIDELIKNGKLQEYRYLIDMFDEEKRYLLEMMDKSPKEVYDGIVFDYLKQVAGIAQVVPGITTGIKDAKSGVQIFTYDGKISRDGVNVDENTRFDIASATKLFTAVEALKLAENGKFSLDKNVSDYGKFSNLQIPIEQMAKFYYEIRTAGRLDEKDGKLSLDELYNRLFSSNISKTNTFVYSDIPFIILKEIMPNSDEYFKKYFNEEIGMLQTGYDRTFGTLTGGRLEDGLEKVNDLKAQAFGQYGVNLGHAGVFTTSQDLVKLFDALEKGFLSAESIKKMITPVLSDYILKDENGNIVFKKDKNGNISGIQNVNRAFGVYYKHPEGIRTNEIVNALSNEAFSITGFTGSYLTFDLKNGMTANILANPLSDGNEREIIIDNEKFTIRDCAKSFANGTRFRVCGKNSKVLDSEGNVVNSAPYTRITNDLKEGQIYTLLKLRLAKEALKQMALVNQSEVLGKEVDEKFSSTTIVRR